MAYLAEDTHGGKDETRVFFEEELFPGSSFGTVFIISYWVRICGRSASGSLKVTLVVLTNIPIKIGLHLQLVPPVGILTENAEPKAGISKTYILALTS